MPRASRFDAELRLAGRATATLGVPAAALICTARRCHRAKHLLWSNRVRGRRQNTPSWPSWQEDLRCRWSRCPGDATARRRTVDHDDAHDPLDRCWHVARVTAVTTREMSAAWETCAKRGPDSGITWRVGFNRSGGLRRSGMAPSRRWDGGKKPALQGLAPAALSAGSGP